MNPWAVLLLALVLIPYWMFCRWLFRILAVTVIQAAVQKKLKGGAK